MEYYKTMTDLSATPSILTMVQSIALAVPVFFPMLVFVFWLLGSASSYFVILKTTGKKRFFNALTSISFVMFLISLLLASLNTAEITVLSGYWVAFYILATGFSWYGLTQYK